MINTPVSDLTDVLQEQMMPILSLPKSQLPFFFADVHKGILQFIWKSKGPRIVKTTKTTAKEQLGVSRSLISKLTTKIQ